MRTFRTTLAAMLMVCALAAAQFDAQAQARRTTTTSASRSSSSKSAPSRSTASKSSSGKPVSASRSSSSKSSATNKTTTVSRTTSTTKTVSASRSASERTVKKQPQATVSTTRQTAKPSTTVAPNRPTSTPSPERDKVTRPVPQPQTKPAPKPQTKPAPKPDFKPAPKPQPKPAPPKVHPRDRDFVHYNAPSRYWNSHNHCYGHRVKVIPSYAHRHVYHGVTYYCYDDIWYRPYGGYYVVCRPPFGTVLAANLIADMTWTAVKLSYYNTVINTYSQINENNEYIAQQNAVIAQNNATIAAQNAQIASSQLMAQQAYTVANNLGLVQSYADASTNYYYQDGVFYVAASNGQYKVILPPAGAIVETIPEDYDMVTLADGKEYYKVDDTVYRITIVEGKPLFEVLGQMYF